MGARLFVGVLVLLGLGVGGWYWYSQYDSAQESMFPQDVGFPVETDTGVDDAGALEEVTSVEEIPLQAVGEYSGSGFALRSYANDVFSHVVVADVPDPSEGMFYEGWLVNRNTEAIISTGKLERSNDGSYSLEYTTEEDVRSYTGVVVTEETEANGLDGVPEAHVLEGSFRK